MHYEFMFILFCSLWSAYKNVYTLFKNILLLRNNVNSHLAFRQIIVFLLVIGLWLWNDQEGGCCNCLTLCIKSDIDFFQTPVTVDIAFSSDESWLILVKSRMESFYQEVVNLFCSKSAQQSVFIVAMPRLNERSLSSKTWWLKLPLFCMMQDLFCIRRQRMSSIILWISVKALGWAGTFSMNSKLFWFLFLFLFLSSRSQCLF